MLINIGKLAEEAESGQKYQAVDRVILHDGESEYRSPNVSETAWNNMTGYIIEADCSYASQATADAILQRLAGLAYQPFSASGATLNPAAELGDTVEVNGIESIIGSADITLDARHKTDIAAPGGEEVEHEYPYVSAQEREVNRQKAEQKQIRTEITALDGQIDLVTEELAEQGGEITRQGAEINLTKSQIALVVEESSGQYVIKSASIITAINDDGSSIKLSADKIDLVGYITAADLAGAGQTVINGANITTGEMSADRIKGGSLTLGGNNNVNGVLYIKDASGQTVGTWDNDKILILDKSQSIFTDADKHFIIKAFDATTQHENGLILGSGKLYETLFPSDYHHESCPYILLKWAADEGEMGSTQIGGGNILVKLGSKETSITEEEIKTSSIAVGNKTIYKMAYIGTGGATVSFSVGDGFIVANSTYILAGSSYTTRFIYLISFGTSSQNPTITNLLTVSNLTIAASAGAVTVTNRTSYGVNMQLTRIS